MTDPHDLQRFVDAQDRVYTQALRRYFGGEPDPRTVELLSRDSG